MKVLVCWRHGHATEDPLAVWMAQLKEPGGIDAFALARGIATQLGEGWGVYASCRPGGAWRMVPTLRPRMILALCDRVRVLPLSAEGEVKAIRAAIAAIEATPAGEISVLVRMEAGFLFYSEPAAAAPPSPDPVDGAF